jgi:hypothetical protein
MSGPRRVWVVMLCLAGAIAIAFGVVTVLAALDHDPQEAFSREPTALVPIFLTNFLVAFVLVTVVGAFVLGILKAIGTYMRGRRQN